MATVTHAGFPNALNPVFKRYIKVGFGKEEDLRMKFFGRDTSGRHQEEYATVSGLPDFPEFTGSLSYKRPTEGYTVTVTHKEFAEGVRIQRKMWDDDQHGQIKKIFSDLGRVARRTMNKDAVQPFNTAFDNDAEFYNHSEAVSLCNNSHTTPVDGISTASGFDNLYTAAISGTALTAARYNMRLFKDYDGEPIDEVPDLVLVPAELEDRALEIVRTRTGLDTNTGNVNVNAGRTSVFSTVRFTDANNWFAVNKRLMKENLIWIQRVPFEEARDQAFDQKNFKASGYMRYSYFRLMWQWIVGHQVT